MQDGKNQGFRQTQPEKPFEKGDANNFTYEETTTRVRKGDGGGATNDVPAEPPKIEQRETKSSE